MHAWLPKPADLALAGLADGSAVTREVLRRGEHDAPVDLAEPAHDGVRGRAVLANRARGVAHLRAKGPDLEVLPVVEEVREALAGGELSALVLPGDPGGAAHLLDACALLLLSLIHI